jgi:TonB family protein
MSAARARKIFIAAIAVSLLLHLIFAGYFRWPFRGPSSETQTINVRVMQISRIPPHTPPPTPVPTPVTTPAVHASIAPPKVAVHVGKGPPLRTVSTGKPHAPVPVRTPTPAPAATATSAGPCVSVNADPVVQATPDVPDIPAAARESKADGVTAIQVALDSQGRVTDASVAQSSGNAGLDAVAMQMARDATYSPKYQDCKAVASTYTFRVKFAPW